MALNMPSDPINGNLGNGIPCQQWHGFNAFLGPGGWRLPVGFSGQGRSPRPIRVDGTQEVEVEQPGSTGVGEVILVVDDDPLVLGMMESILETFGYTVMCAGSAREAIRIVRDHSGEIRMLVTDIVMPEVNGRELGESLKASYPNMKCLYMSGYTNSIINDLSELGPDAHFIQKPFSVAALTAKVREMLDEDLPE